MRADRSSRLRIVCLGYIVRGPLGGLAWHHLQYVLGLARLGHDVHFLEDSDDYESCYDPISDRMGRDPAYGLEFARLAFAEIGLEERWAYYDAHTSNWLGPAANRVREIVRTAELLINISGVNPLRDRFKKIPARTLVDTDPVFTQLRHLQDEGARSAALRHTAFFTFGENHGRPDCSIPDDGLPWLPTRQPVVCDAWQVTPGRPEGRLTTVMQWDSYDSLEHQGTRYGMKSDSFRPYLDLPRRTGQSFELAVGSPTAPKDELREGGWSVIDPRKPTRSIGSFRRYVQRSKGEFSVAKHGYVVSRSGWFSERSTGYLASGRPVVVEDTGFSRWLPTGDGVLSFSSPDEALAALEDLDERYEDHCSHARAIAEEDFSAKKVLASLIERSFATDRRSKTVAEPSTPAGC